MASTPSTTKKALLVALEKSMGVVTQACRTVKIDRKTFYNYCSKDPQFKQQVEAISEIALDFAESQLLKSIKKGSDTATIFYLKTKGKKRGYIETSQFDVFTNTIKVSRK